MSPTSASRSFAAAASCANKSGKGQQRACGRGAKPPERGQADRRWHTTAASSSQHRRRRGVCIAIGARAVVARRWAANWCRKPSTTEFTTSTWSLAFAEPQADVEEERAEKSGAREKKQQLRPGTAVQCTPAPCTAAAGSSRAARPPAERCRGGSGAGGARSGAGARAWPGRPRAAPAPATRLYPATGWRTAAAAAASRPGASSAPGRRPGGRHPQDHRAAAAAAAAAGARAAAPCRPLRAGARASAASARPAAARSRPACSRCLPASAPRCRASASVYSFARRFHYVKSISFQQFPVSLRVHSTNLRNC